MTEDIQKAIELEVAKATTAAFKTILEKATASAVETMQRVNESRDIIFGATNGAMAGTSLKAEAVQEAVCDAIRSLPAKDLIEFVNATGADITQITVREPSIGSAY